MAISFEGLKKTKVDFLERFIETEVGDELDSLQLEEDVQALKNLNLFYDVSVSHKDKVEGKEVTYHLKEVLTLLPIFGFGGIQGCLLYTSPSPRDLSTSRMPSSA